MSTIQPYRIGTNYGTKRTREGDGRSQILATTHGPIRPKRHTHNIDNAQSITANHEAAALKLAQKISGDSATVREVSSNDAGTARDWEVSL